MTEKLGACTGPPSWNLGVGPLALACNQGFLEYCLCYKSVQIFRVTCLFIGQYNTKGYGTITDVIK